MSQRIQLKKSNRLAIEKFSTEVKELVEQLSNVFQDAFVDFRQGTVGSEPKKICCELFDDWLHRSQFPTVPEVVGFVQDVLNKSNSVERTKRVLSRKLPFDKTAVHSFVDALEVERLQGSALDLVLSRRVWELFKEKLELFATQTAYVIVGRVAAILLCNDKQFTSINQPQPKHYVTDYWNYTLQELQRFLPTVFAFGEFDWWYVPPTASLSGEQRKLLDSDMAKVEVSIDGVWNHLRQYEYSDVDTDVWKEVYLHVLAEEYTRRLGFVPTPDSMVELILDLVGYSSTEPGLCKKSLLDPACGSGTFALEATLRLKQHLDTNMKCHISGAGLAPWEKAQSRLEIMTQAVGAIDIHPFASFLTSLNLTFLMVDQYKVVRDANPQFILSPLVITHDSLAVPGSFPPITLSNGRLRRAEMSENEFAEISARRFDFVVGNPPWGGVLLGKLGPLGDANVRKQYKTKFKEVASGKYDIYVLFMAQGIEWLKPGGVMGMITQIMYLEQSYGKGIKDRIRKRATVSHLIDLSRLGKLIFAGFTNYPAITVVRNEKSAHGSKVIEVKVYE